MKVLLVCYDLKKPIKDYPGMQKALKNANSWWHYLDSTWLLKTKLSPEQWIDKLRPHFDQNDYLLVIEVKDNYQGWLPKKAWDWIHKNLDVN